MAQDTRFSAELLSFSVTRAKVREQILNTRVVVYSNVRENDRVVIQHEQSGREQRREQSTSSITSQDFFFEVNHLQNVEMTNNLVRWSTLKEEEVTYEVELNNVCDTEGLFTLLTATQTTKGHFQSKEERSFVNLDLSAMVAGDETFKALQPPLDMSKLMISESADIGDRDPNLPLGTRDDLSPTGVQDEAENEYQKSTRIPTANGKDDCFVPQAPPPPALPPVDVVIPKPQLAQRRVPTPENQQIRDETDGPFSQSTNTAFLEVGERVEYGKARECSPNRTVEEKQKEYLDLLCGKYLSAVDGYFTKGRTQGSKVCHKCIAALICDQEGECPYVATFAAGTRHNDEQMCYTSSPCSMHAESLCYDTVPIYFQLEMSNCLKGYRSIFLYDENNKNFELKPGIEFHLLITEPPCGWIQLGKTPRVEWQESSVTVPHVPTCSSKIFINSKLGIQGYVSHLLTKPIFVDSVIILYDQKLESVELETNFDPRGHFKDNHFQLPKAYLLKYDPERLSGTEKTFFPMNLIVKHKSHFASHSSAPDSTQHEANKQKGKAGVGEYGKGLIHIDHSDGRLGRLFQLISKSTKKDMVEGGANKTAPCIETVTEIARCRLSVTDQMVLEELQQAVDEKFQAERKHDMKQLYNELTATYGRGAIDHILSELEGKIKSLNEKVATSAEVLHKYNLEEPIIAHFNSVSDFNTHMTEVSNSVDTIKKNGKKVFDHNCMIESIHQGWKPDKIGVDNCVTIDCSWQKYFNGAFSSSVQPDS